MAQPLTRTVEEPDGAREVRLAAERRRSLMGQIRALTRELRALEREYGFQPSDLS